MSKSDARIIRAGDLWFAAGLLACAALSAVLLWVQPSGRVVVFRQNGDVIARRSLDEDGTVEISGTYTNVFRIEDGSIRVVETDCPNHACEATGAISQSGAAIICAPNHVSAAIEGDGGLDAYTG